MSVSGDDDIQMKTDKLSQQLVLGWLLPWGLPAPQGPKQHSQISASLTAGIEACYLNTQVPTINTLILDWRCAILV